MLNARQPQPFPAAQAVRTAARNGDSLQVIGLPDMAWRIVRSPIRRGTTQ